MVSERFSPAPPGGIDPIGPLECALAAEARSGEMACASVFRVAEQQGAAVAEAGRAVQRLRIKVTGCQVGCF